MAEAAESSGHSPEYPPSPKRWSSPFLLFLFAALLALLSVVLYKATDFDTAELPESFSFDYVEAPTVRVTDMEKIGEGFLKAAEDLAFDAKEQALYGTCSDGWIRRVTLHGEEKPVVEDYAFVGGRPLGIAIAPSGALLIANAYKGLISVEKSGVIKTLTQEADGVKFKLTDGVDISSDGVIYFSDASSKYNLENFLADMLEFRPHGRVLSFDPRSNKTTVLASDIYFANGVTLSPDQDFLIFCETFMRRCMRYYIVGDKKGVVDSFIENLPGFPDNIHYNRNGSYWIGLTTGKSWMWELVVKYSLARKLSYMIIKYVDFQGMMIRDGGVMQVGLDGKVLSLFTIPGSYIPTGGINIENYLYVSTLSQPFIGRFDLTKAAIYKDSACSQ